MISISFEFLYLRVLHHCSLFKGNLQCRYENARQNIDIIFGQKFHPAFPRHVRPCDPSGGGGCGLYPSTTGGAFNAGIDVRNESSNSVPAPVSGYVQRLDPSLLPDSIQSLYTSSNYSSTGLLLRPAESSFSGIFILLSNVAPILGIGSEPRFFTSGDVIATTTDQSNSFVHAEVIKVIEGGVYRLDPTSYLQPRLDPNVSVELECNDVVTYVGGVVVERRSLVATSELIVQEPVGNPLVVGKS